MYDKTLVRTELLPTVDELFRLKGKRDDESRAKIKLLRKTLSDSGMKWLPFSMNLKK